MFKNSNFFVASLFSLTAAAAAFAQTTTVPKVPTAPPRIERQMQIFTSDGGGYLGVQSQDVTKENFSKFGLSDVRGVAVEKVVENSPAASAGLQTGDVIVRFNGEEVTSARKLTRLVSEIAPDHQAQITVLRGGSERTLTATIGKRQTPSFGDGNFTVVTPEALGNLGNLEQFKGFERLGEMPQIMPIPPGGAPDENGNRMFYMFRGDSRQIGVGVTALNDQLGDYFGVPNGKGILINNVAGNSPAAKAGLKAGDVITEVDGKAIAQPADLVRSLSEKKEGDVTLTIIRNKNRQTVKVTPEKMSGNSGAQNFFFRTDAAPDSQQRKLQMLMQQDDEQKPTPPVSPKP